MERIIKKMGWQDMPKEVATAAVNLMIRNRHEAIADCLDESLCEDTIIEDMLSDEITPDQLWLDLWIDSYEVLSDKELLNYASALRGEIEAWMKKGYYFQEACEEWDIPSPTWWKESV